MTPEELDAKFSAFEKQVENDPVFAVAFAMIFSGAELGPEIIDAVEEDSKDEFEKAGGLQAVHDRLAIIANDALKLRVLIAKVIRERAAGK